VQEYNTNLTCEVSTGIDGVDFRNTVQEILSPEDMFSFFSLQASNQYTTFNNKVEILNL